MTFTDNVLGDAGLWWRIAEARQILGLIQSLLKLAKLNWRVPDFSALSRRQRTLQVQLPHWRSSKALDLRVDGTRIKFLGEGEWNRKKHGAEYRRQWRKVHLGMDASTLEIRAIEVTDNSVGDAPMLPGLRARIPPHEPIASVSTDGTYGTKDCHAAIAQRGAQAVIPPRKNGKPWKETRQKEQQCAMQRCGRAKGWGAGFGSDGAVTTAQAWWRPRCTAANV